VGKITTTVKQLIQAQAMGLSAVEWKPNVK